MVAYTVILLSKHTSETATVKVEADNEEMAREKVNQMIENDPDYSHYKRGWRIDEAIADE